MRFGGRRREFSRSNEGFGEQIVKWLRIACLQFLVNCAVGWAQPYYVETVAGGAAPPTPVPGPQAAIGPPQGVGTDAAGNVYISSPLGCVFKLDQSGTLTRYAGTCRPGYSGDGGPATSAQIFNPSGVATDSSGNLYVAETYPYSRVRKVSPSGVISTVAGNGKLLAGSTGDGGPATNASLGFADPSHQPAGLAVDSAGNIYIADTDGNSIRKVSSATGIITTVAGTGHAGYSGDGGPATSAELNSPVGVAVDSAGNLYIADRQNLRVRKVSTAGVITTVAGNGTTTSSSDVGGPAANVSIAPQGVAVASAGNLYIAASLYIFKVSAAGIITIVAGGFYGFSGDGGPANRAGLTSPVGVAVDSAGNTYIADQGNDHVRKVSAAGIITTVAGNGTAFSGDGGPATSAVLYFTASVATDSSGDLYVTDLTNQRVRKVSPAGLITTVAGNGTYGFAGDGGAAVNAELASPYGLAIDLAGNLYIGDAGNQRVRKVSPGGIITTVAGSASYGSSGDGGPATSAQLNIPQGVAVDAAGNLYIADSNNHRVRKVSPGGTITTVAGNGTAGYTGDGGPATSAELNHPQFVALDSVGNLYIADLFACVVRKVTADGAISSYAGDGACFFTGTGGDGGPATSAQLAPYGIAFDSADNLYIVDDASQRVRKVSTNGTITTIAGQPIIDGFPGYYIGDWGLATNAQFNVPSGVVVDSTGKIYVADTGDNAVRVLLPNTPSSLSVGGGNNQTGEVGWVLPNALRVVVNGAAGVPVPGVTVNFAVTSGSATLGAASVITDGTGTASVSVMLGATPGNVAIAASAAGVASIQLNATALAVPTGGSIPCTLSTPPSIASINSASDFGAFSNFAPGSWLEVHGSNLAADTRVWTGADFQGPNAPTNLDGSSVSIDGKTGYMYYISGGQINVQAPADSVTGPVQITVSTCAGTSAPLKVAEAPIVPGMLAPTAFEVNGKQYLVAQFPDGVTYVGNTNLIPGVLFRPAKPGDTITAYGIGFGTASPPSAPGVVVGQLNSLANLSINFGQTPADVSYGGLASGFIGLYQFNITVPPQLANGDYQVQISVGGVAVPQTLYLTVK